jgi:3-hydroxybutyryl-CoA dehydrogenase
MHGVAPPARAAVVGAGTMGSGFAQLFALAGIATTVVDTSADRAEHARAATVEAARRFEAQAMMPAGAAEVVAAHLSATGSLADAVRTADFVIEAVVEEPEVKREVFRAIEDATAPGTLIATNTSAIPIHELAAAFARPDRFLGTHWFNPPQWVPCVEVIPGPETSPGAVARATALLERLGKAPVVVGDKAGFVANRIQFAMFREAAAVVADGIATAEDVDAVVRNSFGFRLPFYGPFAIADMAGLDVYAGAYAALEEEFGPRFAAPELLSRLVDEGRLGTKSPRGGFLGVSGDEAEAVAARRDASYAALSRLRSELEHPDAGG